jgi:hypothetical protein
MDRWISSLGLTPIDIDQREFDRGCPAHIVAADLEIIREALVSTSSQVRVAFVRLKGKNVKVYEFARGDGIIDWNYYVRVG